MLTLEEAGEGYVGTLYNLFISYLSLKLFQNKSSRKRKNLEAIEHLFQFVN